MIDRRTFLRSGAGAAALTGSAFLAVSCEPVPAPAAVTPELAKLIEAHRAAYDGIDAFMPTLSQMEEAAFADRNCRAAAAARDLAYEEHGRLCAVEHSALLSLLSYRTHDLDELRVILATVKQACWDHDAVGQDEFDALLSGIMGEDDVAASSAFAGAGWYTFSGGKRLYAAPSSRDALSDHIDLSDGPGERVRYTMSRCFFEQDCVGRQVRA